MQITKDSDLIEWNNSECFIVGDFVKYRGKTGLVLEQIHQYLKTDILGAGWINVLTEGKYMVRGVPKTCERCKHFGFNYSGVPSECSRDKNTYDPDHNCNYWEFNR